MILPNLTGKGYYIWNIADCEGGDVQRICQVAKAAGMTHLLPKVADGAHPYNIADNGADLAHALTVAAKAAGLKVWGWHYTYGLNPTGEADAGANAVQNLDLDGYVIDGEVEWKQAGPVAARSFCQRVRSRLPGIPIALSSYRYPSYHQDFPWGPFVEICDLMMPQVYWLFADNPAEQLARSFREYQALAPALPYVPTGAAWRQGSWSVTPAQATEFLSTAQDLKLPAANFWEWAHTRMDLPATWDAIANYAWGETPAPQPQPAGQAGSVLVNGLRIHTGPSLAAAVSGALYLNNPVHITETFSDPRGVFGRHELGWSAMYYDSRQYIKMVLNG